MLHQPRAHLVDDLYVALILCGLRNRRPSSLVRAGAGLDLAVQRTALAADTGSQAHVTLKLPILPETGIIVPGKYVRYVDGATTRIGLTRSVSVSVGSPEIWQTLLLETHV